MTSPSPAPEREAVDNSYFEDAAFVGDSRTDGFMIYSGIGCGENLTSNGLSIFKLEEKKGADHRRTEVYPAGGPGPEAVRKGISVPGGQRAGLL